MHVAKALSFFADVKRRWTPLALSTDRIGGIMGVSDVVRFENVKYGLEWSQKFEMRNY